MAVCYLHESVRKYCFAIISLEVVFDLLEQHIVAETAASGLCLC